ncbi:MAG: nucleoside deaminase [Alphaproteobacteria bacterium]|nr:nucleoside deaminase [Alphaproteobacteria bacterium]
MDSEYYMQIALKESQKAFKNDEVPVGAVIVDPKSGKIIAKAGNKSEHGCCATYHAEILAMEKACKKLKQNRLWDMEMYVTLEPCTMCAAAISIMRIKKVYFATPDSKGGAIINGVKFFDSATCHHRPKLEYGILQTECSDILKKFFKNKRSVTKF